MSERIHCDHCDKVIANDLTHLTLQCGTARGKKWTQEDEPRDYCQDCVEASPLLKKIYDEQFEEEAQAQA